MYIHIYTYAYSPPLALIKYRERGKRKINNKWIKLFSGLIAGNVYDYGAQAFIQKQQKGQLEHFIQALNTVDG